jgi:citrate lyase subunit beta/citryl-CoA lyase
VKGRLFRSVLYVPGDNARAVAKLPSLNADAFIFDLEDGVSPENKALARNQIGDALASGALADRFCVVRINAWDAQEAALDIAFFAALPIDALMLPKVESADSIVRLARSMKQEGYDDSTWIWANIETPKAIVALEAIAASHSRLHALVAGTNDLRKALHLPHDATRTGLLHSLSRMVLLARAHDLIALDGTYIDLQHDAGFAPEALQGRHLGFDGKTLIHPKHIEAANAAFSPSDAALAHAQQVVEAYRHAMQNGKAIAVVNGQMVEKLHYDDAVNMLTLFCLSGA